MSNKESIPPDNIARMVMLVFGAMVDGNPFWVYVSVKPSRYDELQQVVASKTFDIRSFEEKGFGEIIVSGEGVIPPQEVTKQVAAMFNVPIRELFADTDAKAAVAREIARMEKEGE